MNNEWLDRWNERYSSEAYAYGETPNDYLREQLLKLSPGTILFAAEGEGRNAVFAASLGWDVHAFDISIEGKNKALRLAKKYNVSLDYQVGELPELNFQPEQFDALALIYAHFPPAIRSTYHQLLSTKLRPGGTIIFEAFSKKHLDYVTQNPSVGGPRDLPSLFSEEELKADFGDFQFSEFAETEIELNEGVYHKGKGSVIRLVGKKRVNAS
jgi:SAM-dependent methyltransferase